MSKITILVTDDEQSMREFLAILLEKDGYSVLTAASGSEAISILKSETVDLLITDIQMDGMSGLELIAHARAIAPTTVVLAMTAYGSSEIAIDAMKNGAYDYITKPFQVDEIRIIVTKALENVKQRDHDSPLSKEQTSRSQLKDIVGTSEAMQKVYQIITKVADLDSTVLITGESGTGKELVARAIHYWGRRKRAPFISVNCGALPENLLESELFGHQRGSFTGAFSDKRGLLETAEGGTFFLDEIGDTPALIQVKLLQAIQLKSFKRVGGNADINVDVRFIAATNRDLQQLVEQKAFREDLYYRLNVIPVHLPPLRERREDVPLLVGHFLKRFSDKSGTPVKTLTGAAQDKLFAHGFPGNARELENVIERAVALSPDVLIDAPSISFGQGQSRPAAATAPTLGEGVFDLEGYLASVERGLILQALERCNGNKTEAARILGLSFRSLRYRAEKLGL